MLHKALPDGIQHAICLTVVVTCFGNPNFETVNDGHIVLIVSTMVVLGYMMLF